MVLRLFFVLALLGPLLTVEASYDSPFLPHTCPNLAEEEKVGCNSWFLWGDEASCLARGCCWDETGFDVSKWCYYPAPQSSSVTHVHVVQGCHFDAGFADTFPNILNRWFDEFIPLAHKVGQELESNTSTPAKLRFTMQSWIVSLYMHCPEGLGLHCPNASQLSVFEEAVAKGWITWHAFPHNGEAEAMDAWSFGFGLDLTHSLDDALNVTRKTVMSQRDVPGTTRAALPVLASKGITAVSIGVNGGSAPPNVPPAFHWLDETTNTSMLMLVDQGGYGGLPLKSLGLFVPIIIPGSAHALVVDWRGDNAGPPPQAQELIDDFDNLQKQFPDAKIVPSTFDEFVAAVQGESGVSLPVMVSEMGDSWIYGIASDPHKVARVRAARRVLSAAASYMGGSLEFQNASRLFLKNGEHTWGLDQKSTITPLEALHSNWSNAEFHQIIEETHQQPLTTAATQYSRLAQSWTRQRFVGLDAPVQALEMGGSSEKELAALIESAWDEQVARLPNTSGYVPLPPSSVYLKEFSAAGWRIRYNGTTGSISYLHDVFNDQTWVGGCGNEGGAVNGSLGTLEYRTYSEQDYTDYELEYNYAWLFYFLDDYDDQAKVGISNYGAVHQVEEAQLETLWVRQEGVDELSIIAELRFSDQVVQLAGAPEKAWVTYDWFGQGSTSRLNITVSIFNKTSTRLPEALFYRFVPQSCSSSPQTCVNKLSQWISTWPIPLGAGTHNHGVGDDGFVFLPASSMNSRKPAGSTMDRCSSWSSAGPALQVRPWDAGLVSVGTPNPFPAPIRDAPVATEGIASVLYDNIWNTNYIMWWGTPAASGGPDEDSAMWRYSVESS